MDETQIGSQTVETQEVDQTSDAVNDALEAFGLAPKEVQEQEVEETPAATQEEAQPKKITVKYNKEDVEIDEDKVPEYVQKGLALDKVREQAKQREAELDRAAKLLGLKDHAELTANFERIEQERVKKQEDEYAALKDHLYSELEANGVDRSKAEEYIENHPLMKQARQAIEERKAIEKEQSKQRQQEEINTGWAQLFETYPELVVEAESFERGEDPAFFTPAMKDMVFKQGYRPLDAYRLAHLDKITAQTKAQVQQQMIKEQRLSKHAQVITDPKRETEAEVPNELSSAFSMFGLDPRKAKKYVK